MNLGYINVSFSSIGEMYHNACGNELEEGSKNVREGYEVERLSSTFRSVQILRLNSEVHHFTREMPWRYD